MLSTNFSHLRKTNESSQSVLQANKIRSPGVVTKRSFQHMLQSRRRVALASFALMAAAGSAQAQPEILSTWIGNGSVWSLSGNWIPATVPSNNAVNSFAVIINAGQGCNLDMSATINRIGMDTSTTLNLFSGTSFTILAEPQGGTGALGTFSLIGASCFLSSTGANTNLIASGPAGSKLIIGGGTPGNPGLLQMSNLLSNRIYGVSGNEEIQFSGVVTVQGSGLIGLNQTNFLTANEAIVQATQSQPLILDPKTIWANIGVLRALGGTLQLNPGEFNNLGGGLIDAQNGSTVLLNSPTIKFGTLNTVGTGVVSILGSNTILDTVTNTGLIEMPNAADLHLVTSIVNNDTISMLSVGGLTDLVCNTDVQLTGSGSIAMSDNIQNRIFGINGTQTLTNVDNTIRGSGQLGLNLTTIINQSLIIADQATRLVIDPNSGGVDNQGSLFAQNSAELQLNPGTYDQTLGGLIEAQVGSLVTLNSPTIVGGTLNTVGTGVVRILGSNTILDTITNTGLIEMPNAADLHLVTSLANNGTISMLSTSGLTDLVCNTDVQLTGGGTIAMSNNSQNRIIGLNGTQTLTNIDNTIRGSGRIGNNQTTIINQSLIIADQAISLIIDPNSGGLSNQGTIIAQGGGELHLSSGTYVQTLGGLIEAQTGSLVTLNGPTIVGGTLNTVGTGVFSILGSSTILDGVTKNGQLEMPNAADLHLVTSIVNNGSISMLSSGSLTDLVCNTDIQLTGGGTIDMSNNIQNRIFGINGTQTLTNVDNTIRGSGQLGLNLTTIINQSSIIADQLTRLEIDPNSGGVDNQGTMIAQSGAELRLRPGPFTQSPTGLIEAQTGSLVTLSDPTIIGGILSTAGTGVVSILGSGTILDTVTNTGLIEMPNAADLHLVSSIANSGTLSMLSIGSLTDLRLNTNVQLTGGGTIAMSNNIQNRIFGTNGTQILTNVDNTIRGSGQLGLNLTPIVNQGTIIADQPVPLNIDPNAGGFDNQGALRAENNATLGLFAGPFTTSGNVFAAAGSTITRAATDYSQTGGSTIIDGSLDLNTGGVVTLNGGTLGGTGTINADVFIAAGIAAPGLSAGTLTIVGDYTQAATGDFAVELGGIATGQFDVLNVMGVANLAGSISISVINGFVPSAGDTFVVLTSATPLTGIFDTINLPVLPGGLSIVVNHNSNDVSLTITGCAVDLNGDGAVDVLDFFAFIVGFNNNDPAVDLNGDGSIDVLDFFTFIGLFSAGCP